MRFRRRFIPLAVLTIAVPTAVFARRHVRFHDDFDGGMRGFSITGRIGTEQKAMATPAHLAGNRVTALDDGALVIDADSGKLIRTDASNKQNGSVAIGHDAGLMTYDHAAKVAYVADRHGDRIAVVKVGKKLSIERAWKTPIEPYGVALSPDRKLLLVTTIADRTLVAFDTTTGTEKWRTQLAREPRGIAISADGARAVVAYLTTGTIDQIDLRAVKHVPSRVAISTAIPFQRRGSGDAFARGSFAVAFMGASQAVVPFQRETPVQITTGRERTGSYGGGFEPPVSHQVAFVGFERDTPRQVTAHVAQHQTRAIAWDGDRDALYLAGLGNDTVLQIRNASQSTLAEGLTVAVRSGADRCGPDGLAVTKTGDLLVWCAFTRKIQRVDMVGADGKLAAAGGTKVEVGPTLVGSRMSRPQHAGFVIFHAADAAVSQRGAMACSTCHPDNRTDGLSWRIDKHELQTPILAGRMVGTHPFKWDGGDKDLRTSLTMTMKRLGGIGLDGAKVDALQAYVEMLPNVRAPRRDAKMVARGKQLFDSAEVGCRQCHDGATYADDQKHKLTGTLPEANTPSLLGLAASAPYYHDGTAPTLESVLRDRGAVHGMSDAKLTDAQVADLVAFLETL